jgi:hypothetical protein
MNLLLRALRAHPDAVPDVDPSQDVPYAVLAAAVQTDEDVSRLLRAAEADALIAQVLPHAFAGAVPLAEWEAPLAAGMLEQARPDAHREWVEIVRLPGRDYGITLPEDRSPEPVLALFQRHGDTVRRLGVGVVPSHPPTLELRLTGGECGFPYRGECQSGSCRDCTQTWLGPPGQPAGYACRCDDGRPDAFAAMAYARQALDLPAGAS